MSDRHFILHDESGDTVQGDAENTPEVTKLGGISGCEVWLYDKKATPPIFFLGGFANEVGGVDPVFVHHADFINADGSIR